MHLTPFEEVLIIFSCFVAVVFLYIICKKIFYRFVLKKRLYIFPRISTKGIANVAMTIAIATAILLLLTIISSGLLGILFRAYPGWRVNIEGILIKIGGLCFGPIIGLFVGVTTDLLSVALTAGMFHYGYCIAAALMGLFSGLICSLRNSTENNKLYFHLFAILLLTLTFVIQFIYFNVLLNFNDPEITSTPGALSVDILGISIKFTLWLVDLYLLLMYLACLLIVWFSITKNDRYIVAYKFRLWINKFNIFYTHVMYKRFFKNNKNLQDASNRFLKWHYDNIDKQSKVVTKINNLKIKADVYKSNRSIEFVSVFVCIVLSENLIGTLLTPVFDVQMSGALNLGYWLSFRMISVIPSALMNFAIVYPIYRIVIPAMRYNYVKDTAEDLSVPLINN